MPFLITLASDLPSSLPISRLLGRGFPPSARISQNCFDRTTDPTTNCLSFFPHRTSNWVGNFPLVLVLSLGEFYQPFSTTSPQRHRADFHRIRRSKKIVVHQHLSGITLFLPLLANSNTAYHPIESGLPIVAKHCTGRPETVSGRVCCVIIHTCVAVSSIENQLQKGSK